jgi:hypothetical protein
VIGGFLARYWEAAKISEQLVRVEEMRAAKEAAVEDIEVAKVGAVQVANPVDPKRLKPLCV